jgi:hypothetical protein
VCAVTFDDFIGDFGAWLRSEGERLRGFGALGPGRALECAQEELHRRFSEWWLAELPISEAAVESGYSEEGLREMCREGKLTHSKGAGRRGHISIMRCHLPRKPRISSPATEGLADRLLRRTLHAVK